MPGPSSETVSRSPTRCTLMVPPAGENFTALSSRFVTARSSASCSPTRKCGSRITSHVSPGPRRRTRSSAFSTTSRRSTGSRAAWTFSSRLSCTRSPTSVVNSPSWAATSRRMSARAPSGSMPWRSSATSNSTLVRIEVSGVRNSWPASAIRRRCRSRDDSRALSIRLNERPRSATSSSPFASIGVNRPVSVMAITASESCRIGWTPDLAIA